MYPLKYTFPNCFSYYQFCNAFLIVYRKATSLTSLAPYRKAGALHARIDLLRWGKKTRSAPQQPKQKVNKRGAAYKACRPSTVV